MEILGSVHNFESETCPTCEEQAKIRKKQVAEEKEFRLLRKQIPSRYKTACFDDFGPEINTIRLWVENPSDFIFIYSPCGHGKTHLACALAFELRSTEHQAELFFASEMFLRLRNSFGNGAERENEADVTNLFAGRTTWPGGTPGNPTDSVHIFDDVGVQRSSDYTIEAWYNVINYRYSHKLPTVFTSNLSLKEISAFMTDRIASRLASGTVFELKGVDRRLQK